jgi:hypothetical protein
MADAAVFDLRSYSDKASQSVRPIRRLFTIVGTLSVALLLLIVAVNLARRSLSQNIVVTFGAPYIGLGIFALVLFWGAMLLKPDASSLEVGAEFVRFQSRTGRVDTIGWEDPRFRLDLYDYSMDPLVGDPSHRDIRRPRRPKAVVPPEAFDEILERAKVHGLSITERVPSVAWYGHCRVYQLRAN